MATTATLTPRQQQVKDLLDQGKSPAEVAKKLKMTTNSVYQHIARMKGGSKAKPARKSGAKRTTARKSTARKSGAKRTGTRRSSTRRSPARPPAPAPAPAAPAPERTMTPLQAIRHRKSELESGLSESARVVAQAEKALKDAQEAHAKLEASREGELKQLTAAEAALSGKNVAKPRSRSGGSSKNGSGSKAAGAKAAASATPAPAATPEPQSAATPEPEPAPAPAEAPEPVEPPTGDEALAAVGVEQERPGVETVPEFAEGQGEDDPFA